jgi:hypothetical protein
MGNILLVDNSKYRASKIEKLHHNPAQDVAFSPIRAAWRQVCAPGRPTRLPGSGEIAIGPVPLPLCSLQPQGPHRLSRAPKAPPAPAAAGGGPAAPANAGCALSRRNAKNGSARWRESFNKTRVACPPESHGAFFSPVNSARNRVRIGPSGDNPKERFGPSHSDTSCDLPPGG